VNVPTDSLVSAGSGSPALMTQFAFYAALVLSILKIVELGWPAIRPPALRLVLTRELIYRLIDDTGENFFLNATFFAEHSAVLVEAADVVLTKTGETTKEYPLVLRYVGEKISSPTNAFPSHSFYTSSPLSFVEHAKPERLLYLCAMKDYANRSGELVGEMKVWASKLREDNGGAAVATLSGEAQLKLYEQLRGRVAEGVSQLMEIVQLEPGKYTLRLSVTYRRPSGFIKRRQTAHSSIVFEMPPQMRATLRAEAITYFETVLANIVFGLNTVTTNPSVVPLNVVEVIED
jgi:hypothetical protein